jgi:hypothetical protein
MPLPPPCFRAVPPQDTPRHRRFSTDDEVDVSVTPDEEDEEAAWDEEKDWNEEENWDEEAGLETSPRRFVEHKR